MKKLVSIITVTYNVEDTIEKTVESVLGQTYDNIEYIIVDGMSTDGTWEKICKYKDRISTLIHEPDEGLYYAMNKGIRCATGDIIGIINGDDWYEKDAVETAVTAMDEDIDITYGDIKLIGVDGNVFSSKGEQIEDIWFNMVPHPSIFVKRDIYSRMGVFDVDYRIAADYEMILRFYSLGARFKYINHCFAWFRKGGMSTQRDVDIAKEVIRISCKYLDKCDNKSKYIPLIENRFLSSLFDHICSGEKGHFLECIRSSFSDSYMDTCIFGAGYWGRAAIRKMNECGLDCRFVFDNSKSVQGEMIRESLIDDPERLRAGKWNIIITLIRGHENVIKQLKEYDNPDLNYVWFPEIDDNTGEALTLLEDLN